MKKSMKRSFLLWGALLLLGGCANSESGQAPASFGNTVRQNIAAQVINPEAGEKSRAPVYSGERMELAQKRYVLDAVEKSNAPKTSSISGNVGGGQ